MFTGSRQRIVESREHMGGPPAWYTDPERPNELRYWNGTGWTEHRVSQSLDDAVSDATSKWRSWAIAGCIVLVVIVIVLARVLTLFGWGARSDASRVRAAAIERLFTERIEVGDGVISADCRPGDDSQGLGNPWACEVETDSSGALSWTVTVEASGRFRAKSTYPQVPETGMSRGCCVTVRRP